MSNEELVICIQQGGKECVPLLWEQTYRLLYILIQKYYITHKEQAEKHGITGDDLKQEAFFILLKAVHWYDPQKPYKFTSYFKFAMKSHCDNVIGINTSKGRNDILSKSISYDREINEDGLTLVEFIPDGKDHITDIEREFDNKILRKDLESAINELEPLHADLVRDYYFYRRSPESTALKLGLTREETNGKRQRALMVLSKNKKLQRYRRNIIDKYAFKGGFGFWNNRRTSATEFTVLKLLDLSERDKDRC